ncbi:hypothetical protein Pla110_26230 [Polystyrenella longa]|uniref:ABC-2 family transporter protein n=1 Tax=Polystyrenella longa TaxID=2528007 RepID=A0A518CNT5_9PLAN|nr:ABC transporter permease [Polystyrenella longa]QDU80887.1 hypothetical protein Pla110_26230 [Polystyrenella longa]
MTFEPIPYDISEGFLHFLYAFFGFGLMIVLLGVFVTRLSMGTRGPKLVLQQLKDGLHEITSLSLKRIMAIATLTFKEAARRKVFYIIILFALLFMFANWFLSMSDQRTDFQIEVYVSFVLTVISILVIPIVLLLSCWGIPEDIRQRSLHTVVTKPAHRMEVVMGRIFGFVGIGSILLLFMGVIGYFWIMRALPVEAQNDLACRVPVYGKLYFIDKDGNETKRGINTGDQWDFRSYIEGATKGRAIWTFNDFDSSAVSPNEPLQVETRFEAFRTYKGNIEDTLQVELTVVNNDNQTRVRLTPFPLREYTFNLVEIPQTLKVYDDEQGKEIEYNLSKDILSSESGFSLEVRCLDSQQYIGMANPDLFIRLPDRAFIVGFSKAIFGQWLLLVLIVSISVALSCMVKGPIATIATVALLMISFMFSGVLNEQITGRAIGGGPMESLYRMISQTNETSRLPADDTIAQIALSLDPIFSNMLWIVKHIIPDMSSFSMAEYLAKGFDVNASAAIIPSIAVTLSYFLVSVIVGYYCLKLRELESK